MKWVRDHSLSLVIAGVWAVLHGLRFLVEKDGYWYDTFTGHADDAFGAFVIVVATKWFIERGSAESKE